MCFIPRWMAQLFVIVYVWFVTQPYSMVVVQSAELVEQSIIVLPDKSHHVGSWNIDPIPLSGIIIIILSTQ